jgi:membrane protein DedA with SNARE-associated domain
MSTMFEFITNFLQSSGYLGVFLLMAVENIFPPIPSELIMPFAGFVVARGDLNLAGVLIAKTSTRQLPRLTGTAARWCCSDACFPPSAP